MAATISPKGLQFGFVPMLSELRAISELSKYFIDPGSYRLMDQAIITLESFRAGGIRKFNWKMDEPIRTVATGMYDGGHGPRVVGALQWLWELQKVQVKKGPAESFEVIGIASTDIRISNEQVQLARWKSEIANPDPPGCFFHVQLPRENGDFPVPRLPSILLTPADCLDFLLGELFQDDWFKHQQQYDSTTRQLANLHRPRLSKLLQGKLDAIRHSTSTSPWMTLKRWQPRSDIFTA